MGSDNAVSAPPRSPSAETADPWASSDLPSSHDADLIKPTLHPDTVVSMVGAGAGSDKKQGCGDCIKPVLNQGQGLTRARA